MTKERDKDSDSKDPAERYLYVDVADKIQKKLEMLGENEPLPNEHYLAKQYSVSRLTIRHSLALLELKGAVFRQRGRGTIANPTKVIRHNFSLIWLEDDFKSQGIDLETEVLEAVENAEAPDFVRKNLKLDARARVDFVSIRRLIRGQPIVLEQKYFLPGALKKINLDLLQTEPWHEVYLKGTGSKFETILVDTEITVASRDIATKLRGKPGMLAISQRYTHFNANSVPLESGVAMYRHDKCTFRTKGEITYLK